MLSSAICSFIGDASAKYHAPSWQNCTKRLGHNEVRFGEKYIIWMNKNKQNLFIT
jgi:hypothetical protein